MIPEVLAGRLYAMVAYPMGLGLGLGLLALCLVAVPICWAQERLK
jgi:hypothetical protein